jgi:hypothetical protein
LKQRSASWKKLGSPMTHCTNTTLHSKIASHHMNILCSYVQKWHNSDIHSESTHPISPVRTTHEQQGALAATSHSQTL